MAGKIKNWLFLTALMMTTLCSCKAQTENPNERNMLDDSLMFVKIDTSYSFINYNQNHLILGSDSSYFKKFAEKWYSLLSTGEGHINIIHLGASHVQGGTFPHRIRRNFLIPLDDLISDRGMIFPYSAAPKCNNPFDYRISRSHPLTLTRNVFKDPLEKLGLCGIAVTAADSSADIGIRLSEPDIDFTTNRIVLLGESRGNVVPQITYYDNNGKLITQDPDRIDTLLRRYNFSLEQVVDSFHIVLPCTEGQSFALTGVYLANDDPGVSFHSIGVNGASVTDYSRKCPYMYHDLQMLKPDLVIFGIGINDASGPNFDTIFFQRRYLQIVDSIRAISPDCAFVFVTNNDSYRRVKRTYSVNNNGPLAREAFLRIAEKCGGAVWDQFTIMGGLGSMDKWFSNELAQKDRVHFTRKGYEIIGDLLSNAIFETIVNLKPDKLKSRKPAKLEKTNQKALYKKIEKQERDNKQNGRPNYISY